MRLLQFCLILSVAFAVACRKPHTRSAPAYSAAVAIWDGPNACGPATSFLGGFYGGQYCATPAGKPSAPGAVRIDFNFGAAVRTLTPPTYVHGYSFPTPLS